MNPVDGAILAVLVISAGIGLLRGLTREFLGLLSWGAAAFMAFLSLPALRHIARGYVANPLFADTITVFVSFLLLLFAFSILSHIFSGYVKDSGLGGLDRVLGLAFGVLRGAFILAILELGLSIFVGREAYPPHVKDAKLTPIVVHVSESVKSLLPEVFLDTLRSYAPPPPAPPAQTQPALPLMPQPSAADITQQAVDALAQLKPQSTKLLENKDEASYNAEQRGDMNRLFQTTE